MSDRIFKIVLFFFLIIVFPLHHVNCQSANSSRLIPPGWSKNSTIYEANIRQFSPEGTFKAFEKDLPLLKEMGVGIIWLMPINPIGSLNRKGSLGSYYSVRDYKAVNPEFGTLEDFKDLVRKIHTLGMHVIIDWVANHSSWDNVWVKDHPGFFKKDSNGNFAAPVKEWTDVIKLDYDNKELREKMIDALSYWITECDIDGYRCDVAAMVPTDFWIEACGKLRKIKDLFMLAEANENYLHQAFNMSYNWPLKDLMGDIVKGKKSASDIISYYESERKEYGPNDYRMVFTSNHDENSWNGTEFERLGAAAEEFAVLCGTVRGMPLIYNGQEAGMNKRLRFFDKDTILWKAHPMRNIYTTLNQLKSDNEALWNGSWGGEMKFIETGNSDVLAFIREKGNSKILTVFNLSPRDQHVKLSSQSISENYNVVLDDGNSGTIKIEKEFTMTPWQYKIYSK